MRNLRIVRIIGLLSLLFSLFSCDNELHMYLPQGPQGDNGLSAYEVWVQEVNKGNIVWDKNYTDINNFFLYLKGEDGKDGNDGNDGQNGQSAYELWKEEVAKGIEDTHNPGQQWAKDQTTIQDFWYYLTGAKGQDGSTPTIGGNGNWFINGDDTGIPAKGQDGQDGSDGTNGSNGQDGSKVTIGNNGNWFINGKDTGVPAFGQNGNDGNDGNDGQNGQSAYELWVQEVANGIEDPHNPGQQWPTDKITTQDFWEFLRGKDGSDGQDGAPGEIGQPGKEVTVVKGKPNVISQYVAQEFSEFVRWSDGGVAFIVYDDEGNPSPGAKVKGLPGVQDPDKVYIADASGQFIVPKEDLPVDLPSTDRWGATAEVEYLKSTGATVTEVSASNTYVPNKMHVRLRMRSNPYLSNSGYFYVYPIVERKTDLSGGWDVIPVYLGNLTQKIIGYKLDNQNDPTSYTDASTILLQYNYFNISSTSSVSGLRLVKSSKYVKNEPYPWDGNDHYFNIVLDSYYGEKPCADAVVKMAPVQYVPFIKNVKAYSYNSTLNIFSRIEGEFDIADADIDYNLCYKSNYSVEAKTIGTNSFDYYAPELEDASIVKASRIFEIQFYHSDNPASNASNRATIDIPAFTVATPYLGTSVQLRDGAYSRYFKDFPSFVGILRFGNEGGVDVLKIVGVNNASYNFPDVPVQNLP
ncbi:MAG: hypothetical protein E6772_15845 [Dysgonomonas sp.]|nr:hypothetical protein [Dysgonomonas sp.]